MAKICLARVDRIGDFVLSLPSETYWRAVRPADKIEWLVHENLSFIVEAVVPPVSANYIQSTPSSLLVKLSAARNLSRKIREKKFDEVVALHVPWWVALAFWLAGVPKRTGVASQWFSFVFYNHRLRQKRSRALKHESEYNFDLMQFALGKTEAVRVAPARLVAQQSTVEKVELALRQKNVDLKKLVVIHAGMAGSARNWPAHFYRDLALKLTEDGMSVVATGSAIDRPFIDKSTLLQVAGVVDFVEKTRGNEMLALLSLAKTVVVPSTGVAHMAASLGTHVVGIYSPVRVQAPVRWRPLGDHVEVKVPQVQCPGILNCLGTGCPSYDCMEQITVESVRACVMGKKL